MGQSLRPTPVDAPDSVRLPSTAPREDWRPRVRSPWNNGPAGKRPRWETSEAYGDEHEGGVESGPGYDEESSQYDADYAAVTS